MTRAYIAYIPRMYRARIYPVPHIEIYARPIPPHTNSRARMFPPEEGAGGNIREHRPFRISARVSWN
jgi:hypothetical protein